MARDWGPTIGVVAILAVIAAGFALVMLGSALKADISYNKGYRHGSCEAKGGTYVADGIEIEGEMVYCIEAPKSVEVKEQ